jgi:hypothetical protein
VSPKKTKKKKKKTKKTNVEKFIQPDDGIVVVSRAAGSVVLPSK